MSRAFAQVGQALAHRPEAALAKEAECGMLDGGELEVHQVAQRFGEAREPSTRPRAAPAVAG